MRAISIFILVLILFSGSILHAGEQARKNEEVAAVQSFAVCHCLAESYRGSDVAVDALNAAGGYFETGTYSAKLYFEVQEFAERWARGKTHKSKHDSNLSVMKCLDLYNNQELISLIRKLQ